LPSFFTRANVLEKKDLFMVSFHDKAEAIKALCLQETSTDPIAIARKLMAIPTISLHGPEHHMLDGSAFLTAYKNAGGQVDLSKALERTRETLEFDAGRHLWLLGRLRERRLRRGRISDYP
jgi:hypothetical protein